MPVRSVFVLKVKRSLVGAGVPDGTADGCLLSLGTFEGAIDGNLLTVGFELGIDDEEGEILVLGRRDGCEDGNVVGMEVPAFV